MSTTIDYTLKLRITVATEDVGDLTPQEYLKEQIDEELILDLVEQSEFINLAVTKTVVDDGDELEVDEDDFLQEVDEEDVSDE